jgi:alkylhydroperoxidase family enzyme
MMPDAEIVTKWTRIVRLYKLRNGWPEFGPNSLGRRLALAEAAELEASGVTAADIDRLFPRGVA